MTPTDLLPRIETMPATVAVPITDTAQMRRLTEFAADVNQLADERIDLELRELIDALHADLIHLTEEED
jgi:replicative DNA helicase